MATRAFLLCGDEKAVHAISQILDELEVSFEHSSEPPFALKRLPAQRFDVLIVDCDNAQNATQVFNSARASSLNKNSIAIAIVEGKAGVPNAFRLGASLVLTKPVSLEQARNTLRTGIGMTKKDGAETKAPTLAPTIPHPTATSVAAVPSAHVNPPTPPVPASTAPTPVTPHVVTAPQAAPSPITPVQTVKIPTVPLVPATPAPTATAPVASSTSHATTPADTKVATATSVEKPAIAPKAAIVPPPPALETKPAATSATETKVPSVAATTPVAKAAAAASTSIAPTTSTGTSASPSLGKASTASPASTATSDKKAPEAEKKSSGTSESMSKILKIEDPLADELETLDPMKDHGVPSFGALSREPFAGGETEKPRRSKLPLVAALVLVLLGGGAYAAWLTQPNFRALMTAQFGNAKTKIDEMRGKAPVTAVAKPQPAPVAPAPAQQPATVPAPTSENIDVSMTPNGTSSDASADSTANNTTTPADATTNSTGAPTPGNASTTKAAETSAPAPATASKTDTTKQPKLQSAKQDATPGKNAALVPASLPPTTTAKAPSSDLFEVPEDFADDQVIHRVHPAYPKQALTKKLHGSVTLQVIVNKQGKVDSLALVSGDPVLGQAAQSAVKQWRYKPYWHNGEPTDFQTHVTVDFKLP